MNSLPEEQRRAKKITTLDQVERQLTENMLVIADVKRQAVLPVLWAALIGSDGRNDNGCLGMCIFKGSSIRKTGRALGLRSGSVGSVLNGASIRKGVFTPLTGRLSCCNKWGLAK